MNATPKLTIPVDIKIVKAEDRVIIPDRKAAQLKRIAEMESELGRMMKLVSEMRDSIQ